MPLSFVNDLGFIASGISIKKTIGCFEKVAKKMIEQRKQNAVTYNTSKTEAILFSKSHQ